MPIENFTGVSITGLDVNNPAGTDPGSDIDNHQRGVKTVLKYTFPNFTLNGQVTTTQDNLNSPLLTLTKAANKVPYFDSASTATTFDITAFGRSMANAATASAALTLLGADAKYVPQGTAIITNITTSGTVQAGAMTVSSTAPTVTLADTDWGNRSLHHNGGTMGFLNNGGGYSFYNDNSGNSWIPGTAYCGEVYLTSDPRLKEGIRPISPQTAESFVRNVKGYTYRLTDTKTLTSGVLSTEVAQVVPALVTESEGYDRVNYSAIIPYLLVHINAQTERLDQMSRTIDALHAEVMALKHADGVAEAVANLPPPGATV